MLTAEFSGAGGLGWGISSIPGISTVTGAVKTATSAVTSAASSAGSAAVGVVKSAGSAAVAAAAAGAQAACGLTTNSSVQTGAAVAQYGAAIPHPYGQAASTAGQAVQAAGALCTMAYPPKVPAAPTSMDAYMTAGIVKSSLNTAIKTVAASPAMVAAAAAAGRYKAGSMARFNRTRGVWSVYSPLAGALGCGCKPMSGLGDGEVDPPIPAGFVKAGEELAPPAGVVQAGEESDKKPLYKNPYFWLAVGGGVAAVGGGVLLLRRRRAS